MALKLKNHNTLQELKQEMRKATDGRYQLRVNTIVLLKEGRRSSEIREHFIPPQKVKTTFLKSLFRPNR